MSVFPRLNGWYYDIYLLKNDQFLFNYENRSNGCKSKVYLTFLLFDGKAEGDW